MKMKVYGETSLYEFLGDCVVYRNLEPSDPNLPKLRYMRTTRGYQTKSIPRKAEIGYADVIIGLLKAAQKQRQIPSEIRRMIYIGDTHLLDGTAYGNLCQVSGWRGLAFICSENMKSPSHLKEMNHESGNPMVLANRWESLRSFSELAIKHNMPSDESSVVIIDIDKTALGARGRNDQVIDRVRVQAVQDTVAEFLGNNFDQVSFQNAYYQLNKSEFHPFTTDNQDYLAYICLMLVSGTYQLDYVITEVENKRLITFWQFIEAVNCKRKELPKEVVDIHDLIFHNVKAGDPTPFKAFRRNEYLRTIARFGDTQFFSEEEITPEARLGEEVLITQEVREIAQGWQEQGALLFGLSDKPDEAATPTPELTARGYLPIHRALTHALGEK